MSDIKVLLLALDADFETNLNDGLTGGWTLLQVIAVKDANQVRAIYYK